MGKFDFIDQDKRIMEQKLRRHELSRNEYQKVLKTLPDEQDQAEEVVIPDVPGEPPQESHRN